MLRGDTALLDKFDSFRSDGIRSTGIRSGEISFWWAVADSYGKVRIHVSVDIKRFSTFCYITSPFLGEEKLAILTQPIL